MSEDEKYPECAKRHSKKAEAETLTRFVDWLEDNDYRIVTKNDEDVEYDHEYSPLGITFEELFAKFFGIDLVKVDEEQRAMLEEIRTLDAQSKVAAPAKVEAFVFQDSVVYPRDSVGIYVELLGKVTKVSHDAVEGVYSVSVDTYKHGGYVGLTSKPPKVGYEATIRIYRVGGGHYPDHRIVSWVAPL